MSWLLFYSVVLSNILGYLFGYYVGKREGFEAGREHELDKAAQRRVNESRSRNMQHKKNPCSPPLGSP